MNFKKYHVSRNLWTVYPNQTYRGVTFEFTNNTIKMNNTCTQEGNIGDTISLKAGTYTIAANANINISQNTHILQIYKANVVSETISLSDMISGKATFTIAEDTTDILIRIHVMNGVDYSGLEIRPMLNTGSQPLPYEPYSSEVWHDTPHYIHNTSTDTLTILPAVVYPNAATATVGLKGQAVQSSVPSPTSPVMPNGCGNKTANLFDKNATDRTTTGYIKSDGSIQSSTNFSASGYISINGLTTITLSGYNGGNEPAYCLYDSNKEYISGSAYTGRTTITVTVGTAAFIRISYRNTAADTTMVNKGSTALPHEPHGYKIPISSANTTTTVYLGEVETTRKIKKLVLTGEEDWTQSGTASNTFYCSVTDYLRQKINITICSHYTSQVNINGAAEMQDGNVSFYANAAQPWKYFYVRDSNLATVADLKSYLAAQYANGTPVTIWYVLAESVTVIENEPLMRIGDYADTLSTVSIPVTAGGDTISVDTTVQPSEVTVNYKGWHPVLNVHEFIGNYTIGTMQTLPISELETHTISELQGGEWS